LYLSGFAPANFTGPGFMGFTASTGGTNDRHSIKDVVIYTEQAASDAGADVAVCNGDTAFIGTTDNPLFVYSWSPSTGLNDTTISNPYVVIPNTGNTPITQTYTVTTSLALNPGVCPTTDQIIITINPTPTSGFTVSSQVCNNDTLLITYIGNMGLGATYNWDLDGGNILSGSGQGPLLVQWDSIGTRNISLEVIANACTSSVTSTTIDVFQSYSFTESQSACGTYTWPINSQTYTVSGQYSHVFQTVLGCDSVYNLDLLIIPNIGSAPDPSFFNTGNNGAGGTLPGGANDLNWTVANNDINGPYSPAFIMTPTPGSYYSSPWPDATWIAHNVNGAHTGDQDYYYKIDFVLACQDICGGFYTNPNIFCLNLDFFADNSVEEIYVNGIPQSANIAGVPVANPYQYAGYNQAGSVSVSLCNGWQSGLNSLIIKVVSGQPFEGFLAQASINPPPISTDSISQTICGNTSYTFGSQILTTSGIYIETLQNQFGCDSIVTLDLTVLPIPTSTQSISECDSYTWNINSQTYTQSGLFNDTLTNAGGCDSVVFLNLTIRQSTLGTINPIVCDTFVAPDGQVYDATGTYTAIITNQNNCDSVITINLVVEEINSYFTAEPNSGLLPLEVNFTNGSTNAFVSLWNFGDSLSNDTLVNPNFTFTEEGEFLVTLVTISPNGCVDTSTTLITVEKLLLLIPNVFTPNGDGKNDLFKIDITGYKLIKGEIYNRWGINLFEWENPNEGWDGKTKSGAEASTGTYFYIISLEDEKGNPFTKNGIFNLFK